METTDGDIRCQWVVLAAGLQTGLAGRHCGNVSADRAQQVKETRTDQCNR